MRAGSSSGCRATGPGEELAREPPVRTRRLSGPPATAAMIVRRYSARAPEDAGDCLPVPPSVMLSCRRSRRSCDLQPMDRGLRARAASNAESGSGSVERHQTGDDLGSMPAATRDATSIHGISHGAHSALTSSRPRRTIASNSVA